MATPRTQDIIQRISHFISVRTEAVAERDYRAFVLLNVGCLSATAIHMAIVPLFAWLGAWSLVLANGLSLLAYVAALSFNRRGAPHLSVVLCFGELAVHQTLCVWLLGWASGFQYYLLAVTGVAAVLPAGRSSIKVGVIVGAGVVYIALAHLGAAVPPVYAVDPTVLMVLRDANIAVIFPLLGSFAWHFNRAAILAEERLATEHARSQALLHNILPAAIVERLGHADEVVADSIDQATILFADIVGFTSLSADMAAGDLVAMLNDVFSARDELTVQHGLEKIKTIGDAYMVAAGVPEPRADHALAVAAFALEMKEVVAQRSARWGAPLLLRVGIHSGPVIAGVNGTRKFCRDIWGDSVNTAARMESHGLPGEIQVTDSTRELLKSTFCFQERGVIEIKGKGQMHTWLLRSGSEGALAAA